MPQMDGHETSRRIRALEKEGKVYRENARDGAGKSGSPSRVVPIIAVTASEGPGILQQCLAAGMQGCVFKPCSKQQMCDIVASATALDNENGEVKNLPHQLTGAVHR